MTEIAEEGRQIAKVVAYLEERKYIPMPACVIIRTKYDQKHRGDYMNYIRGRTEEYQKLLEDLAVFPESVVDCFRMNGKYDSRVPELWISYFAECEKCLEEYTAYKDEVDVFIRCGGDEGMFYKDEQFRKIREKYSSHLAELICERALS